jgi:aspartyl/asparaginyl-tRNA synthetase
MENMYDFNYATKRMRNFFQDEKGFIEVPAQSRQSILAACEDPATISQYIFSGINYPLPQTGQMWLERDLLENPDVKGVFCVTTSYRNEPNPVEGRHEKIFPMFEFESHGNVFDMIALEKELLEFLGFGDANSFKGIRYDDACNLYNVNLLDYPEEELLCKDMTKCVFLGDFPLKTHPFWNMKHRDNGIYNKVDVIMHGMETIGSAERAVDVEEMREQFHNISDGEYANLLFNHFGRKRVEDELEEYLAHDMFERFGGGIGVTRMVSAMKAEGIMEDSIGK